MNVVMPVLIGVLTSLVAVILHLHKIIRRAPSPALRALLMGAVLACTASLVRLPAVSALLRVNGVDLTWLAYSSAGILCLYYMLCYVYYTLDEPEVSGRRLTRHLTAMLTVITVLVLMFALAPHSREFDLSPQGRYVTGGPSDSPIGSLAWLVLGLYLLYPLQDLSLVSLRWARKAASIRWLSIALRIYAYGAVIAGIVNVHTAAYQIPLVIPSLGPLPWTQAVAEAWPLAVAGTCTMVGLSATGVYSLLGSSARLRGVRRALRDIQVWWQYYHANRRLYRLWWTLWRILPGEAHHPPRTLLADMLRIRATRSLYRRTIELRDFQRRLHMVTPPQTYESAESLGREHGFDDDALSAVVDAAGLAVGRHLYLTRDAPRVRIVAPVSGRRDGDLTQEARWWLQVSRAFFTSAVVATVLDQARRADSLRHDTSATGKGA